jgi:hypothetical protein
VAFSVLVISLHGDVPASGISRQRTRLVIAVPDGWTSVALADALDAGERLAGRDDTSQSNEVTHDYWDRLRSMAGSLVCLREARLRRRSVAASHRA